MSAAKQWAVRPSRFPFGVSEETLGVVGGESREEAQRKAEDHYGRHVVVELQHAGSNSPERNRISRQNGMGSGPGAPLGLRNVQSAPRQMTADEAQMARAAACAPGLRKTGHLPAIRLLHARSLASSRTITDVEAHLLRSVVRSLFDELPEHIVAMAGAP